MYSSGLSFAGLPDAESVSNTDMIFRAVNCFDSLLESLREFIDDEECDFDHHGYCQTHSSFEEGPCIMVRAREAIAKAEGEDQ